MNFTIQPCSELQFETVRSYIKAFDLDGREPEQHEFLVALYHDQLLGFGRVREHTDCSEICSLGVVIPERSKGIGKKLMAALMQKAKQPLFLVCVIPGYFKALGFYITEAYPAAIKNKMAYCNDSLPVDEAYVVLRQPYLSSSLS